MNDTVGVTLTVRAAEKRDAGRGIARLPETARKRLGLLSGDTVRIEGERAAVAKVWPGGADARDGTVLIDADTRANAGVKVGDTVAVSPIEVADARRIVLAAPAALADVDVSREVVERALARDLRDRPVTPGEAVHVERLGGLRFVVDRTEPSGTVRVSSSTTVEVVYEGVDEGSDSRSDGSTDSSRSGGSRPTPTRDARESGAGSNTGAAGAGRTSRSGTHGTDGVAAGDGEPAERTAGATYEDIGGLDEELELVRETIELPLSEPEVFTRLGVDPPKGVLLYGPPGTGKTLIARAVANEVDATFITVDGPEIMSKYKGESEERLRDVFERASEESPAIVFFDEIDSIAGKRDDGGDVENRVVGQLLSLMDGLDARGDVIVIGATNRVDSLDPALRRGGRFDREIEIGVPGEVGRRQILDVHTRRMPLADDVDLDRIASRTHGFVGADIEGLTQEAAMTALRRAREDDAAALATVTVAKADFEAAHAAVEPSAMREYVAEQPTTDFSDVGGLPEAKEKLERAVTWPLTYGPLFDAANADPPTGVLLHGPPGTGKTLLARAIAGESGVNFIQVAGPELLDRYVGESEKAVRDLFDRARQAAPVIVFFDEIDAVATDRDAAGGGDSGVGERVVSQLLTELDRASDNPNLVVLSATNRRAALDPALLRPGRLETHIEVPEPDRDARRKVFEVHTRDKPVADDVDLDRLADETEGYSGAEIAAVCREAAMTAIERVTDEHGESANDHADEVAITDDDFSAALGTVAASQL
ncbi:transitional endoplasmic reticulum ATPase [Halorubrum alkaliphilum]|uniref:Transitional endoplasmic reticulum ATPase n=1 Tax=Halorubrum alkaliphilum TaxID=261290 RepID=A0A8T4GHI7_9EURY|nr:AAA family ATPase [Halorubrum alkaliphilum]MBP1923199.1 transitional endoplasmic reticulum ATPase [Halorubrum alkaliphilum]